MGARELEFKAAADRGRERAEQFARSRPIHSALTLFGVIALLIVAWYLLGSAGGEADGSAPDVVGISEFDSSQVNSVGTAVPTEPAPSSGPAQPEPTDRTVPTPIVNSSPATLPALQPDAAPVRLSIPALTADAAIVPVGVASDGQMEVPDRGEEIGWYRYGAAPGSEEGTAVLASHITTAQGWGVLSGIGELEAGDVIAVQTDQDAAPLEYVVSSRRIEAKADLDTARLFDRTGDPRLVLVTCTGPWLDDRGAHRDNLILEAVPRPAS